MHYVCHVSERTGRVTQYESRARRHHTLVTSSVVAIETLKPVSEERLQPLTKVLKEFHLSMSSAPASLFYISPFSYTCLVRFRVAGGGCSGAYPGCHWVRGGVLPGRVASPSQAYNTKIAQSKTSSLIPRKSCFDSSWDPKLCCHQTIRLRKAAAHSGTRRYDVITFNHYQSHTENWSFYKQNRSTCEFL